AGFTAVYTHPKSQAILGNAELRQLLLATDLKDFKIYLETGKSPKFDDEKLLGRWRADVGSTVTDARRKRASLQPADLKALRFMLNTVLKQASLTAYIDGRYVLKVPVPVAPKADAAAAPAAPAADLLTARYGRRPGAPGAAPVVRAAPPMDPMAVAKKILADGNKSGKGLADLSTEGTWLRASDKYVLSSKKDGKEESHEASISEVGRLAIPVPELKLTLFFVRAI
ncbi:MAG: hypothetical protein WCP53_14610, partial [Verrucomicrobiota bacterium]